jgi:hypothetical protein
MSLAHETERTDDNAATPVANGPKAGGAPAEGPINSTVEKFRRRFYTDSQFGLLLALGEEPQEYQQIMESLLNDLEPRQGLESQLVDQIGQALWRMRRAQRIQDGLALKRISNKVDVEEMVSVVKAEKVIKLLEPFERLRDALGPRRDGPTEAEIEEFAQSREADTSPETLEFLDLLRSLLQPMEKRERTAARREVRAQLQRMMDGYENLAWQTSRQAEKVRSPENMAAMMAPGDHTAQHMQSVEDSCLRRLWRLTNLLAKVKEGAFHSKKEKNNVRSRNVYENKQNSDTMPDEKSDICVDTTRSLQK